MDCRVALLVAMTDFNLSFIARPLGRGNPLFKLPNLTPNLHAA